ncbi:hypothetical protein GBA52_015508 [Prunus armeniaca]|nr:hypothetical protein GBA52_015508 [Prunus armeniaca]
MEAKKATDVSNIQNEVIESTPPLKVGEERELGNFGLKRKLGSSASRKKMTGSA